MEVEVADFAKSQLYVFGVGILLILFEGLVIRWLLKRNSILESEKNSLNELLLKQAGSITETAVNLTLKVTEAIQIVEKFRGSRE